MAEGFLTSGSSFLVETTLSGHTYLRMMVRAKKLGYLEVLLYVGTSDVSINLQRVRNRVEKAATMFRRKINCGVIRGVLPISGKHLSLPMK